MGTHRFTRILLRPVGRTDEGLLRRLRVAVEATLCLSCEVGEYLPRPLDAFDHGRNQYDAIRLIERVAAAGREPGQAQLGLFDHDIFVEPYRFTFGHVDLRSGVGVLSLTRLRPEFWGEPDDDERFARRAVVETLYQLGRILGLSSCDAAECAMCSVNGIGDVDRKQTSYCPECMAALGLDGAQTAGR